MTSKLKVKKRVKSNMLRTMGGQEMASTRMDTKPCMLDRKIFRDWATDTRGGKSNVDENTANRMSPRVQKAKMSGMRLGGQGRQTKFSM
jgi:hypothetical protein